MSSPESAKTDKPSLDPSTQAAEHSLDPINTPTSPDTSRQASTQSLSSSEAAAHPATPSDAASLSSSIFPPDSATNQLNKMQKIRRLYYLIWAIIGCVLLGIGAWYLLGQMTSALAVIILAAFLVFLLRAPVDWLESKGIPRWAGALIAYIIGIAVISLFGLIIIPLVTEQLIGLISQVPDYVNRVGNIYESLYENYGHMLEDSNINQIFTSLGDMVSDWAIRFVTAAPGSAISFGTNLVTGTLVFLISLVAGYWVLKDLPVIKLEVRTLISPRLRDDMSFVASAFSRALGGYLRGMVIVGSCIGFTTGIGFALIGLPYPALLGLIAGLMIFIPIFGSWITGTIVVVIGLFNSVLTALLAVVILLVAVWLTDYLITPRVMSSTVELHPAMILVGVLAGGALAGVIGLIAAIPLLAAAKSIFVYYFEKQSGRKISHPQGAIFRRGKKDSQKVAVRPDLPDPLDTPDDERIKS